MRLPILLVHENCPQPTGPKGSLLAFEGGHPETGGARYRCESCDTRIIVIDLLPSSSRATVPVPDEPTTHDHYFYGPKRDNA